MAGTLFVTTLFADTAYAQNAIDVKVDGKQVQFDASPEVLQGRTMIPIRAVVETMGADVELSGRDHFTIRKGSTLIKIYWNSKTAYINGKPHELPIAAYTKQDRTYVPLRFISEAFAATVGYDQDTHTVLVESFDLAGKQQVEVESVQDGETFRARINGVLEQVRLASLDAPNEGTGGSAGEPHSLHASQYLRGNLASRTVYLEYNPGQRDEQGRLLAYVYQVDGTFINAEVIKNGLARVLPDTPNKRYLELFEALSKEARAAKKGIWKPAEVPSIPPVMSPAKPAGLKLAFPVISDPHVQSTDAASQRVLKAALEDLHGVDPTADALVINGDLGNGQPADYTALRSIISSTPHPSQLFYTMGNHEYYRAWVDRNGKYNPGAFPNGESELMSIRRFLNLTRESKVYYDKWVKDHHFIFLGSERYRQSYPELGENAYLSQQQLDWLQAKLTEAKTPNRPIFVFLHQPLPYTVNGSHEELGVMQHRELREILAKHPEVILFSGHTHYVLNSPYMVVRDTFTMVNSSSVYRVYDPIAGNTSIDRSQGLYVEVYEGKVVIRGRDFAKRMWIPEAEHTLLLQAQ